MVTKLPSLAQRSKQRIEQDRLIEELRARHGDTKHRPAKIDKVDRRFEASRKHVRRGR